MVRWEASSRTTVVCETMLINIQFDEAAELLWDLFKAVPKGRQKEFAERVNRVSCCLQHPSNLDRDVTVAVRSDYTPEGAITLRGVVLPMEGL